MSTTLIVRIQDVVTHTSVPGPPPGPDGVRIFPHLPGPDISTHKAFDLKLEWRPYSAGADPWQTDEEGMLPVKQGSWSVMDPTDNDLIPYIDYGWRGGVHEADVDAGRPKSV